MPQKNSGKLNEEGPFANLVKGDVHVDNPDGCVYATGLGPYEYGPRNSGMHEGAMNDGGGVGARSGKAKRITVI